MKNKTFKYYKTVAMVMYVVGISLVLAGQVGPGWIKHDFFSGLGTGLLIVAVAITIKHFMKRNEEDYYEDLEAAAQDERLKLEKTKMNAFLMRVMLLELIILVTVSVFKEFTFAIGGGVLLWTYIIAAAIYKFVMWKRNK